MIINDLWVISGVLWVISGILWVIIGVLWVGGKVWQCQRSFKRDVIKSWELYESGQ